MNVGAGFGGAGKVGPLEVSALAMIGPGATYSSTGEELTFGTSTRASTSIFRQIGVGGEIGISSCEETANNYGLIFAPDRQFNYFGGLIGPGGSALGLTNTERIPDVVAAVGIGLYILVGADVELSFNFSEFLRRWRESSDE